MQAAETDRTHRSYIPPRLEPLEPRSLLAAPYDFAAVGVRYDDGPRVFLAEGTVAADDSISGTLHSTTFAGPAASGPIDWTHLNRSTRGGFTFDTRAGFTPYASQAGTQFLRDERWNEGTFAGFDSAGRLRDHAALGQVYDAGNAFGSAAQYGYQMRMTMLTASGGTDIFTLDLIPPPQFSPSSPFTFVYHFASGDVTTTKAVTSYTNGRAVFDTGEVLVLLGYTSSALLADLDPADGIVGVAEGRAAIQGYFSFPAGWCRSQVAVTGPRSAAFFGLDPATLNAQGAGAASVVIQFDYNDYAGDGRVSNTWRMFRAADWDAGGGGGAGGAATPIGTGTWRFIPGQQNVLGQIRGKVEMITPDGTIVTIHGISTNQMHFVDLDPPDHVIEPLWGVASRQERPPNQFYAEHLAHTDADGRPIVIQQNYQQQTFEPGGGGGETDGSNTTLYSFDLIREAGGEPVVGELIVWTNIGNAYGPGFAVAGLSAAGHVQLWQVFGDAWSYLDLTAALPGARPITGALFSTSYATSDYKVGQQFLTGFDDEGKFVVYHQFITPSYPLFEWHFIDAQRNGLDGEGVPEGTATLPDGLSPLSGWSSSWGAAHFAATDPSGELWSIWWAPGMAHWRIDSLTQASGGPLLAGAPAATFTQWNTFHITGLDAAGHVIMTWWSDQTQWQAVDLTAVLNGPTLTGAGPGGGLIAYAGSWNHNLNIVGKDDSGAVRVYWWSTDGWWQTSTITDGVPPDALPTTPWRLTAAVWAVQEFSDHQSQSVLGENSDGHLVRWTWRNDRGPDWAFEDLTGMAVAYYV